MEKIFRFLWKFSFIVKTSSNWAATMRRFLFQHFDNLTDMQIPPFENKPHKSCCPSVGCRRKDCSRCRSKGWCWVSGLFGSLWAYCRCRRWYRCRVRCTGKDVGGLVLTALLLLDIHNVTNVLDENYRRILSEWIVFSTISRRLLLMYEFAASIAPPCHVVRYVREKHFELTAVKVHKHNCCWFPVFLLKTFCANANVVLQYVISYFADGLPRAFLSFCFLILKPGHTARRCNKSTKWWHRHTKISQKNC